jgi:sec-independent protein translocase protein TatA
MLFENLLQPTHLILVLAIALLVFGPKNLPQVGKGLGEAIRGFKEAVRDDGENAPPASR